MTPAPHPSAAPSAPIGRRTLLRRTGLGAGAAGAVLLAASCTREDGGGSGGSPTTAAPTPDAASFRARLHLTPAAGWVGDPQRPLVLDGVHHVYGLLHAEEPAPGATVWGHWTSTDLVTFEPQAPALTGDDVADVWSGSAVVDERGTAGLGEGTVVALATRPTDGKAELQEQYLASSPDGATFTLEPEPVLRNEEGPAARSEEEIAQASWFRDPKLQRDEERDQWVCAIGRDHRVALWTSPDLRSWERREDFAYRDAAPDLPDLGGVECPDLFTLTASDGSAHWVLGASLDGSGAGEPTAYAYWVGTWDGERFTPEDPAPRWLDRGWDWYAGVTWPSPEDPEHVRLGIGWMNNWAYAREGSATADSDGYDGQYSVVREVRLQRDEDGSLTLVSTPVPALAAAASATRTLGDQEVDGEADLGDLGPAFTLEMDLAWEDASAVGLVVLGSEDAARGTRITIGGGALTVDRSGSAATDGTLGEGDPFAGLTAASAPVDEAARSAHLHVVVDTQSVEVFLDDGRTVISLGAHPAEGEQQVRLLAEGGTAQVTGMVLRSH
ncbi:2,6-beta-fructan 6-levanbiohydrolase [Brachybacterium rhamnosum]|uniref:Glycoside hydrolase family 32 protein n=1 Tax=Brachybacterium rhamnosum TaxID=173361 RepID=A0ABW4PXH7_9MICO